MPYDGEFLVTVRDKGRVFDAIQRARGSWSTYAPCLDTLQAELRRAEIVPPNHMPDDIVTMNSRFELADVRSGAAAEYELVYPDQADEESDPAAPGGVTRVSVISPAGTALLGLRVGDMARWTDDTGSRLVSLRRILYQPEAAGEEEG